MNHKNIDPKPIAKEWVKEAERLGQVYFWQSMRLHRENMNRTDDYPYTGIHALAYKTMEQHPWGQELLKYESIK